LRYDESKETVPTLVSKEERKMFEVNKKMTIGEVVRQDRETAPILMQFGMHCLGCPHAQMESLEQAGMVHGCDVDALVAALNEHFAKKA